MPDKTYECPGCGCDVHGNSEELRRDEAKQLECERCYTKFRSEGKHEQSN